MGCCDQHSGRTVGTAMVLYFLFGLEALPERRMVVNMVTVMIICDGAVAVLWPIFPW